MVKLAAPVLAAALVGCASAFAPASTVSRSSENNGSLVQPLRMRQLRKVKMSGSRLTWLLFSLLHSLARRLL